MDVVLHPIYLVQYALSVGNNSPNIFIQAFLLVWGNRVFPVVGAKYDVIKYLSVAVHDMNCFLFLPPVKTEGYLRKTPTELPVNNIQFN